MEETIFQQIASTLQDTENLTLITVWILLALLLTVIFLLISNFIISSNLKSVLISLNEFRNPNLSIEYNRNMAFGEDEKAKQILVRLIWNDFEKIRRRHEKESKILMEMNNIINDKYLSAISYHNLKLPEFIKYV